MHICASAPTQVSMAAITSGSEELVLERARSDPAFATLVSAACRRTSTVRSASLRAEASGASSFARSSKALRRSSVGVPRGGAIDGGKIESAGSVVVFRTGFVASESRRKRA